MIAGEIAALLPAVLQATIEERSPLEALLEVMAKLRSSIEEKRERFPQVLSAWHTPPAFVAMLERWVAVEPATAVDEVRARQLIRHAAGLWRLRGTELGIVCLLELATGIKGFRVAPGAEPFAIVLDAPSAARAEDPRLRRIVELMKPAAVRFGGVVYREQEVT